MFNIYIYRLPNIIPKRFFRDFTRVSSLCYPCVLRMPEYGIYIYCPCVTHILPMFYTYRKSHFLYVDPTIWKRSYDCMGFNIGVGNRYVDAMFFFFHRVCPKPRKLGLIARSFLLEYDYILNIALLSLLLYFVISLFLYFAQQIIYYVKYRHYQWINHMSHSDWLIQLL